MTHPESYPEVLADMADCIHRRLCLHLHDDQAGSLALDIIEALRTEFGGGLIYFPKGQAMDRSKRNEAILAEFNRGKSYTALAKQYRLTISTIYGLIARQRKKTLTDSPES